MTPAQNAVAISIPGVSPGDPWCVGLASTPFPATVPYISPFGEQHWEYDSGPRLLVVNVFCNGNRLIVGVTIGEGINVSYSNFPGALNSLSCVGGHLVGSITLPLVNPPQTLRGLKGTGNPCGAPDIAAPPTITLTFS